MSLRCSVLIQSKSHQNYWVSTDSSQGCWGYLQVYPEDGDGSLLYPMGVPQSKGHLLTYNTCILQKGNNRTRHARVQASLLTPLTLWPRSRHDCFVTLSNLLLHVQMYSGFRRRAARGDCTFVVSWWAWSPREFYLLSAKQIFHVKYMCRQNYAVLSNRHVNF